MRVLVVNAGSSSLKLRLLDGTDRILAEADLPAGTAGLDTDRLAESVRGWPAPDAIGHRIVHGGSEYTGPVRITGQVRARLDALTDLAPLHQPKSLAALDVVSAHYPDAPAVACFDTAFHATMPAAATTYPIPAEWRDRYHARRYGFHGLSHAYATARASVLLDRPLVDLRVVSCHLGAGASLAAVTGGRSVDTTMGFTPLDGLVMATRSGSLDPGLVTWLEERVGLTPHQVATALETRSGLLALAGTGDMRQVLARAGQGDPQAGLALEVYLHRLITAVGAMTAAAGGLDALIFTGGVGENAPVLRQRAAEKLAHLGVVLDSTTNADAVPDTDVSGRGARARTLVVAAREDLQISGEVRRLLG